MLREVSTYGAAILTTMVVIRAVTMQENQDHSSRYQRTVDNSFIEENLSLRESRNNVSTGSYTFLAANFYEKAEQIQSTQQTVITASKQQQLPINNITFEWQVEEDHIPSELATLTEDSDSTIVENLSLDRESTINNGLSVIFNRSRIHPKPTQIALNE